MHEIRIQNLRSLVDTDWVPLRPITLLLGANSSGKSTFLRTFPLLRQSTEARTVGPILWFGSFVDFGSFEDAVRADSPGDAIKIGARVLVSGYQADSGIGWIDIDEWAGLLSETVFEVTITIERGEGEGSSRTSQAELIFGGDRIQLNIGSDGLVTAFVVNNLNVLNLGGTYRARQIGTLVPSLTVVVHSPERSGPIFRTHSSHVHSALFAKLKPFFHWKTSASTINQVISSLGVGSPQEMLDQLRKIDAGAFWHDRVAALSLDDADFQNVRNLVIASRASQLLAIANTHFVADVKNVTYIAPIRATAQRYYRPQSLAVDEVDVEGRNLAIFLRSLSEEERTGFREWMAENFGFFVSTQSAGGHLSVTVSQQSGKEHNLADVGFGLSQMLPVVTQLWSLTQKDARIARRRRRTPRMLAVEQPELHLHPRLQAEMADVFMRVVQVSRKGHGDFRLVIETHSETLINRFGYQIAARKMNPRDIGIVLFERDSNGHTALRFAEYDAKGLLQNWPYGFFEPAPPHDT